jgi:ATP-dependent Clp protease ATP-binding subunit ClpA
VNVELSAAARTALVKEGYDPAYGARPLRRVLQRRVENPLAKKLLSGEFGEHETVLVDITPEGEYTFKLGAASTDEATPEPEAAAAAS